MKWVMPEISVRAGKCNSKAVWCPASCRKSCEEARSQSTSIHHFLPGLLLFGDFSVLPAGTSSLRKGEAWSPAPLTHSFPKPLLWSVLAYPYRAWILKLKSQKNIFSFCILLP